jgi:hypothetical protein
MRPDPSRKMVAARPHPIVSRTMRAQLPGRIRQVDRVSRCFPTAHPISAQGGRIAERVVVDEDDPRPHLGIAWRPDGRSLDFGLSRAGVTQLAECLLLKRSVTRRVSRPKYPNERPLQRRGSLGLVAALRRRTLRHPSICRRDPVRLQSSAAGYPIRYAGPRFLAAIRSRRTGLDRRDGQGPSTPRCAPACRRW